MDRRTESEVFTQESAMNGSLIIGEYDALEQISKAHKRERPRRD